MMETTHSWSSHRIYYLASGLFYCAVVLRSLLVYQNSATLPIVLGLLVAWLVLFLSQPFISRYWDHYFPFYLACQTALIILLLLIPDTADFFATLLVILSMQFALHYSPKAWAVWAGLCGLGLLLLLTRTYPTGEGVALAFIYSAANVLMSTYTLAIRRSEAARQENQALADELGAANQQLQAYSQQLAGLAVARERNRLARELHDSVTQTVFSMNLASQSAALLLEKDPTRVDEQLNHLRQLAASALEEMQTLISELRPEAITQDGLVSALRRHLDGARIPAGLEISLQVQGEGALEPQEEQGLYRIAQEALNNITKHSQASQASISLSLDDPPCLEIQDQGQGFDLERAYQAGRVGLASMQERAAEIGWQLQIQTSPGAGTCLRVVKAASAEGREVWKP
jgi:signal transduction histidine kinase